MKLKDILDNTPKHNRIDWVHFIHNSELLENGLLFIKPIEQLHAESTVELHYHFWWHLNPNFPKDEIQSAIENKDYTKFKEYFYKYGFIDNMEYLPANAWLIHDGDLVGHVSVAYCKELFDLITFSEYECG